MTDLRAVANARRWQNRIIRAIGWALLLGPDTPKRDTRTKARAVRSEHLRFRGGNAGRRTL